MTRHLSPHLALLFVANHLVGLFIFVAKCFVGLVLCVGPSCCGSASSCCSQLHMLSSCTPWMKLPFVSVNNSQLPDKITSLCWQTRVFLQDKLPVWCLFLGQTSNFVATTTSDVIHFFSCVFTSTSTSCPAHESPTQSTESIQAMAHTKQDPNKIPWLA